ncbi:hypothetical protein FRB99_002548 [Tulasnella sp. 403]|nr:hypothetical protein FRB99_002548 [Tulasnella sp. 403]
MFLAKIARVSDASSAPHTLDVLVKLVNHSYGEDVHKLLASHSLAPVLHGTKCIEGAPAVIVMEYLQPPSGTSGWVTIHDFARSQGARLHKVAIREGINNILDMLQKNEMFHGDLRANNVMLKVDSAGAPCKTEVGGGACLKVIDFDWAGGSGEVRYPIQRNEKITWPAARGEPIAMGYDCQQVDLWWEDLF